MPTTGAGCVVVTGASTGIGRACALMLARGGYTVFAGARRPADGDALVAESPERIRSLMLDVTDEGSIAVAVDAVGDGPLVGLVNNAGIAVTGPLELLPTQAWRNQYEVNVFGLVAVTRAFLPLLRRDGGRIVNVGSIAGRSALPGSAPYDSSKYAVEAITDALRMEVHASGIGVSLIEPGSVSTPAWAKTLGDMDRLASRTSADAYARYAKMLAKLRQEADTSARTAMSPDVVAKHVLHALSARRPKTRYVIGLDAWFWLGMNLLPDRWRDRLILSELSK